MMFCQRPYRTCVQWFLWAGRCDTTAHRVSDSRTRKTYYALNVYFLGASACVKLHLYEEAINWCVKGLEVSFFVTF